MNETLAWWLSIQVLGAVAFPVTFLLFRGLKDRGYSLAKIVGLVFVGYALWLGGVFGVLPHTRGSVILLLLLFAVAGLALVGRNRERFVGFLRERWRYILLVEALFTVSFFVAAWLRAHVPDGIGGTEKPMEAALLSSLLRDPSLPAEDPWLSGHDINYYYFGYLLMASQMKLLGLGINFGFNLALITIVALGSVAAFGVIYNLLEARLGEGKASGGWLRLAPVVVGLGAVLLLFVYSNYEALFEMLAINGVNASGFYDFVKIDGLDGSRGSTTWYPTEHWWWWRASRLFWAPADCGEGGCPYVITEFPFFSFLIGDVHPHVLAIPFFLLVVAMGWNLFAATDEPLWRWRNAPWLVGMGVLAGSIGFIHTINLPIVLALLVVVYALREYRRHRRVAREFLASTGVFAAALTAGSLVLYLPFYATYQTPTSGILATDGPDTRLLHTFVHWGLFLLLVSGLAVYAIGRRAGGWRFTPGQLALAALPALATLAAWLVLSPGITSGPQATAGASGWLTLLWLAATLVLVILAIIRTLPVRGRRRASEDPTMLYALTIAALAVLVVLGSELFFVKDVFNSRLNTVFKGWYVAWLLLGLAGAFSAYVLLREWRPKVGLPRALHGLTAAVLAVLVIAGFVYPVTATMNRTNGLENRMSLDGLAFLRGSRPGEYDAIRWLTSEVSGRPVVMEAIGDSFSDFSRVSAYTGLPTVLGWAGHENQWRGSFEPQGSRARDVEDAYNTTDTAAAQAVLDRYDVEFVYVGPLERQKYQAAGLEKFVRFMDVGFQSGDVTVYQRRAEAPALIQTSAEE